MSTEAFIKKQLRAWKALIVMVYGMMSRGNSYSVPTLDKHDLSALLLIHAISSSNNNADKSTLSGASHIFNCRLVPR